MRWLGVGSVDGAMHAWWTIGLAAAACVIVGLWRRSTQLGPVAALGLSLGALVLLGPVVHPWYLLWAIVPLAVSGSMAIRRAVAVLSVALVLFVLPGGVQPGIPALVGATVGAAGVLSVLVVLTGLGRRQLLAPLVAGPIVGKRGAVIALRWPRPSAGSATAVLEPVPGPNLDARS
jgi:alpha-1,6-mannosyltransferase